MASRYFNDAGEPLMTAAQARFEDNLDNDMYYERDYDEYDENYYSRNHYRDYAND